MGSKFTNALVKAKCEEHRLHPQCIDVTRESVYKTGPFAVEFFHVNHSIPGALGIVVKSPAGVVVQTGDIKVDQTPKDNIPTDLPALSRFGDDGIDLMLVDSTNATHKGLAPSEAEIEPTLRRLIRDAEQLVVVACFASNVTRVQMVADAAVSAHRKLALTGRSMVRNMNIAAKLEYLTVPDGFLVELASEGAGLSAVAAVVLARAEAPGLPPAALDAYLADIALKPFTPKTVTSPDDLQRLLMDVRRQGHCIVDQELELGLRSVACPVRGSAGTAVAAVNVSAHAGAVGHREVVDRLLPPLQATALAIERDLHATLKKES